MGRKKDETERTCATCAFGPDKSTCVEREDCDDRDQWQPKPPECDGDSCKISVNGGPAVPFPSKEAEEQMTGMVKKHLGIDNPDEVVKRNFVGGHVLEEYADGRVSLDGGQHVTKDAMKVIIEGVKELGTDTVKKVVGAMKQLDLEGKPLPEPEVQEDESTETKTYALYYSNGLKFRMGEEALDKALELKKKEGVNDRKDRIKLMVQNRSKVNSGRPLDPDRWDAGTRAIYERIMVGHGREP